MSRLDPYAISPETDPFAPQSGEGTAGTSEDFLPADPTAEQLAALQRAREAQRKVEELEALFQQTSDEFARYEIGKQLQGALKLQAQAQRDYTNALARGPQQLTARRRAETAAAQAAATEQRNLANLTGQLTPAQIRDLNLPAGSDTRTFERQKYEDTQTRQQQQDERLAEQQKRQNELAEQRLALEARNQALNDERARIGQLIQLGQLSASKAQQRMQAYQKAVDQVLQVTPWLVPKGTKHIPGFGPGQAGAKFLGREVEVGGDLIDPWQYATDTPGGGAGGTAPDLTTVDEDLEAAKRYYQALGAK